MATKLLITRWWIKFAAYNTNYEVKADHPRFDKIKELLKDGKTRQAVILFNNPIKGKKRTDKKVVQAGKAVTVKGNDVAVGGTKLPEGLSRLYEKNIGKAGGRPLQNFLVRFAENPSPPAPESFSRFLESNNVTITSRGTMLLYKRLNSRYYDCHSNTFDNSPGTLVSIPREKVDPNPNHQCSYGLHVCAHRYLGGASGFGNSSSVGVSESSPIVVVEVDPRDVVSVPPDSGNSKIRVCRYKVWLNVRDFRATAGQDADILGNLRYFDIKDLPAMVAAARNKPNSDLTKDWR